MKRRNFIQYSTAAAGFLTLGKMPIAINNIRPALANDDKILVIVQLFGGNDALNTIIPVEIDSYYNKYRPKIQIKKQEALKITNSTLAMHPSLKSGVNNGLLGLYDAGKLAIVQGIGYENPSFSHFRSTDIWLSGRLPKNDAEVLDTGWIGRYFDDYFTGTAPQSPYSIHVSNSPSLLFEGKSGSTAVLVENPDLFYQQGKELNDTATLATGNSNYASEYNYIDNINLQSNRFSKVIKDAFDKGSNQEQYTNKSLSNQLKLVSRLISGGLKTKIYFVGINGFDTHAAQGTTDGAHAALLAELSEGVASFMSDLNKQKLAENVVGISISEFGRRANDNASNGTDHGAASVMFAFGDAVNGKIYGKSLLEGGITADNNFIYQYDYRRVYTELLQTWLGTSAVGAKSILGDKLNVIEKGILKNTKIEDTTPSKPIVTDIYALNTVESDVYFSPNPFASEGVLKFKTTNNYNYVIIDQYDLQGRHYGNLFNSSITNAGLYQLPVTINGAAGTYLLKVNINGKIHPVKIYKN